MNVHIAAETTVEVATFADQGRATVAFTGYRHASDVTLFLRTAELRELRDLLTATLAALTDNDSSTEPPAEPAGDAATGSDVIDRAA